MGINVSLCMIPHSRRSRSSRMRMVVNVGEITEVEVKILFFYLNLIMIHMSMMNNTLLLRGFLVSRGVVVHHTNLEEKDLGKNDQHGLIRELEEWNNLT